MTNLQHTLYSMIKDQCYFPKITNKARISIFPLQFYIALEALASVIKKLIQGIKTEWKK